VSAGIKGYYTCTTGLDWRNDFMSWLEIIRGCARDYLLVYLVVLYFFNNFFSQRMVALIACSEPWTALGCRLTRRSD